MNQLKQKNIIISAILTIFVVFSGLAIVIAQNIQYPTYEYYGEILSADEFLKLVENDVPLNCVQLPSVESYLSDRALINYACFNTLEEVDVYYNEVLALEWEQIAKTNPAPQISPPPDQVSNRLQ